MTITVDAHITSFVLSVVHTCNDFQSVWLIGSRANGTAHSSSDWDLIGFGSEKGLACLRQRSELHRADVDFLVVTDGNAFENAWGEREKTGSLAHWEWNEASTAEAEYTEAEWVGGETNGSVVCNRRLAVCLWRRATAP